MKFKSKKVAGGKPATMKFYFDEEDKKSGVELTFITMEKQLKAYNELVREEVEYAIHPRTRKLTKVVTPEVDTQSMEEWIVDNRISNFWGIFIDDEEIPVTKENKLMLYRGREVDKDGNVIRIIDEEREFASFVDKKYLELEENAKEIFGGNSRLKNS